jgi:hypothetical protein
MKDPYRALINVKRALTRPWIGMEATAMESTKARQKPTITNLGNHGKELPDVLVRNSN